MTSANDDEWSKDIAILIADSLADAGMISREQMPRATEIIAEEIWVTLIGKDYPPGSLPVEPNIGVKKLWPWSKN